MDGHHKLKNVAFLHAIQAAAYRKLGKDPPRILGESEWKIFEKLRASAKKFDGHIIGDQYHTDLDSILNEQERHIAGLLASGLVSPYENPENFDIIDKLSAAIRDGVGALGMHIEFEPTIGTLPTGSVNASILLAKDFSKETVILLDDGIFPFANQLVKAIVGCMPVRYSSHDNGAFLSLEVEDLLSHIETIMREELIREHRHPLVRFGALVSSYVYGGDPRLTEQYFLDPRLMRITTSIRDAFELFVLGHEYAHSILGHLPSSGQSNMIPALADVGGVSSVGYAWKQELEADALGFEISVAALVGKGVSLQLAGLGPLLFFKSIDVIEEAVAIGREGSIEAAKQSIARKYDIHNQGNGSSHPPPLLRLGHIRRFMRENLAPEQMQAIAQVDKIVEIIFSLLGPNSLRSTLKKATNAASGFVLANKWR